MSDFQVDSLIVRPHPTRGTDVWEWTLMLSAFWGSRLEYEYNIAGNGRWTMWRGVEHVPVDDADLVALLESCRLMTVPRFEAWLYGHEMWSTESIPSDVRYEVITWYRMDMPAEQLVDRSMEVYPWFFNDVENWRLAQAKYRERVTAGSV